jgi:predicted nucleic acid-binding protein
VVLVDTSVFISFFNGKNNSKTDLLKQLLLNSEDIAITGLIYQEVLQGIRTDNVFRELKGILDDFYYINTPESIYLESAQLFRKLQSNGVTIRKSIDITIAQSAINSKIPILEHDRDFTNIAKHSNLKIFENL